MGTRLTTERIDPASVLGAAEDGAAGGAVLFVGRVRNRSESGAVERIEYEAYVPMAERRLAEIEREVRRRWPVRGVEIVHRVGSLGVGEVSVAVAVSAPHRAEAFEACTHAIERIKHEVPIWKKERLAGGEEVWVEGRRVRARSRRARVGGGSSP